MDVAVNAQTNWELKLFVMLEGRNRRGRLDQKQLPLRSTLKALSIDRAPASAPSQSAQSGGAPTSTDRLLAVHECTVI